MREEGPEARTPPEQRRTPPRRDRPDPERTDHDNVGGQWGNLPPVAQELLYNPNTDELPVRYRRWIEEYFRRVQRSDR
jgi:hypothetical protein